MTTRAQRSAFSMVFLAATCLPAYGDEPAASTDAAEGPAVAESPVSIEQIRSWVSELDSRDFGVRRQATAKLFEAGAPAVDPVADAADTDDLEMTTRCLDVLKRLYQSDDAATRKAAEKALGTLAKSDRRSVAQRAVAATAKPEPAPQINNPFGNVRIQVQGIQIAQAAGGMRMQVRNVNGKREIEVEQNGQKIAISDNNGKEIVVRVSETVDGKETKSEYKAADLEELQKKHPQGAEIYKKYATGRNGIRMIGGGQAGIQIQAAPIPLPALPVQPIAPANPAPAPAPDNKAEVVEKADARLSETIKRLRQLAEENAGQAEDLRRMADELEKTRRVLKDVDR